jgi:hypothetical protein
MANKKWGQIAYEMMSKQAERPEKLEQIDIGRAMMEGDYLKNVLEIIEKTRKVHNGEFFIEVRYKQEHFGPNSIRFSHFTRLTCPTPITDQVVYKYTPDVDELELLWVLPSDEWCTELLLHKHDMAPELYGLLKHVLDYKDGTLLEKCQKHNKETFIDNRIIIIGS